MSFSRILGQERAKRFLKEAMARERIPHAYLFTGIPGIGKTSMAIAMAMALNCRKPINAEGCGDCVHCRQMLGGNFPDFVSIKPEGPNIKIQQIRDLSRALSFAPVSGKYRVCIIYQAQTITIEAANSLLKTLEEPPSGNILILNAPEPLALLPTIVSRCQRVPFQPLPVQDIMDWLVKEKGLNEEEAKVLARISAGSLGRAFKMSGSGFLDKREQWLTRIIRLPALSRDGALEMALECALENKKVNIDSSAGVEDGIMDMLAIWESWYRDLLCVRVGGPIRSLINMDFSRKLQNIAENYKIDRLVDSLLMIDQAQRDLRRMRNAALVMEHTVLGLNRLAGDGKRSDSSVPRMYD
ncbi:MAG: DNA polymerase III subunit delta' [Thermodesulfobacteriota bacterium]|nr:DNA polymerase III subunit delta' [Thermodesulfobacteriota bacterium]